MTCISNCMEVLVSLSMNKPVVTHNFKFNAKAVKEKVHVPSNLSQLSKNGKKRSSRGKEFVGEQVDEQSGKRKSMVTREEAHSRLENEQEGRGSLMMKVKKLCGGCRIAPSPIMSLLSWNRQGLRNPQTVLDLRQMVREK
jgi:hypothetical protein